MKDKYNIYINGGINIVLNINTNIYQKYKKSFFKDCEHSHLFLLRKLI